MRKRKIIMKFIIMAMVALSMISCTLSNNGLSQDPIIIEQSSKQDISGKDNLWTDKKLNIMYISSGGDYRWYNTVFKNIKDEAKVWNISSFDHNISTLDEQIKYLKQACNQNIHAIAFCPRVETGWDETLTKVKEAGIPIILIDRTVNCADESLWHSRIVNDFDKEGQMAGEWVIEYLEKQGKLDEEIKIAELNGTEGAEATKGRGQGFREAIKNNINLEVVVSKCSDYTYSYAYDDMANILSEITDIDVLFCHNDDMALGAIEAIEEAGLVPGEDIIIVSIMGTNAALKAIVDGKIACSVECNPLMGDLFMEACVRLANGEEIEREIHPVDRVFDITNAQAELDARKENGYGY